MRMRGFDLVGRRLWSRRAFLRCGGGLAGGVLVSCGGDKAGPALARDDGGMATGPGGPGDVGVGEASPTDSSSAGGAGSGGAAGGGAGGSSGEAGGADAARPDAEMKTDEAAEAPMADAGPAETAPETAPEVAPAAETHPPLFPVPTWVRDARLGGFDAETDDPDALLDAFAAQGVSVVELDANLSAYMDDAEFTSQVKLLDDLASKAHARGMKAIAYYPTLESLTPNVAATPHSMAKDHPDWMQIDMAGKPNVFVGGGGRIFWVDVGTESAWCCPSSPYADYFIARVARLAATALDGLWGDVPLLSDIAGVFPCTCQYCKTRFKADTGLALPSAVDWTNPIFRRWVQWRHWLIWDFEQRIAAGARKVRADFQLVIETVSIDYSSGTAQGLDGASHDDGNVIRMWEVDVVSDQTAMRNATVDDWTDIAAMMKYCAGVSQPRPSWIFCYGLQADDAEHVFGLAVAAGNNPFEVKIPQMTTSVGPEYRSRVFKWLAGEPAVFDSYPLHQVGLLYSSASRDFLDQNANVGLYESLNPSDELWWTTNKDDRASALPYLADQRGWAKALINTHTPYDVLPAWRASAEILARYKVLIVPSAIALADATVKALADFAAAGGTLIVSGADAGRYDDQGGDRGNAALLAALSVSASGSWTRKAVGKGTVAYGGARVGQQYLLNQSQQAATELGQSVVNPQLITNAPAATVMSVRRTRNQKMVFLAANLDGLGQTPGTFGSREASYNVGLWMEGRRATKVVGSQPGSGATALGFEMKDGRVQFSVKTRGISVVTISYE